MAWRNIDDGGWEVHSLFPHCGLDVRFNWSAHMTWIKLCYQICFQQTTVWLCKSDPFLFLTSLCFLPAVEHHQPSGWDLPAHSGHTWRQHHDANAVHVTHRCESFAISPFLWAIKRVHVPRRADHWGSYPPPLLLSRRAPSADVTVAFEVVAE